MPLGLFIKEKNVHGPNAHIYGNEHTWKGHQHNQEVESKFYLPLQIAISSWRPSLRYLMHGVYSTQDKYCGTYLKLDNFNFSNHYWHNSTMYSMIRLSLSLFRHYLESIFYCKNEFSVLKSFVLIVESQHLYIQFQQLKINKK